jgi:hypothetical protein
VMTGLGAEIRMTELPNIMQEYYSQVSVYRVTNDALVFKCHEKIKSGICSDPLQ